MPVKKKQTSRLNSLDENYCKCEPQINRICSDHLERSQIDEEILTSEAECADEIESEEFKIVLKRSLSRTSLLIQDYKEFKAARCIQRYVRGWLYRGLFKRKRWAAIVMQREWRRFYCQRQFFHKLEAELQHRIDQHFYRAAEKIQALWRGWWVRRYVHDLTHLKNVQLMAGEDLLYCVAFKLHHLLRTHQIPGIYSLRNSNALSKVEKLLASLRFRAFNLQSRQAKQQICRERWEAQKQHKKSAFGTKIPFPKNIHSLDHQKCSTLYKSKDADIRMTKIIQMYEEETRKMSQRKVLRIKGVNYKVIKVPPSEPSSFCGDVVKSMKKWKIITEKNLIVDANIFKKPENVENFLNEIESKLHLLEQNPSCGTKCLKEPYSTQVRHSKEKAINMKNHLTDKDRQISSTEYDGIQPQAKSCSIDSNACDKVQSPVKVPSNCSLVSSVNFTMDVESPILKESDSEKKIICADNCFCSSACEDFI